VGTVGELLLPQATAKERAKNATPTRANFIERERMSKPPWGLR
jgi:hypothetical protein